MIVPTRCPSILPITVVCALLAVSPIVRGGECVGLDGGPGDFDGDGVPAAGDCDDKDLTLQTRPGEARTLMLSGDALAWQRPSVVHGSAPLTYNLYRATGARFQNADCIALSLDLPAATDPDRPSTGGVFFYLVEAQNGCGGGGVGVTSLGAPRGPVSCDCSVVCDDADACTADACGAGACSNTPAGPAIAQGPGRATGCDGGSARFDVTATGGGPLSYQWFVDAVPVGPDAPVLTLVGLSAATQDGALIHVEVTDGCATTASEPARLVVLASPGSCDGGLDGQEAPNRASGLITRHGPARWMAPESTGGRAPDGRTTGGVHGHSGEYTRTEIDLVIPGRGFDFVWSRTYRSREFVESSLGHQWTHGYERRVENDLIVQGDLRLRDGSSARADRYSPSPTLQNCWEASGFFRTLCARPDGRYVLTFADRHEWVFRPLDGSPAEGRIESSVDRNGNAMTFQYDGLGRLVTIVDTLGRAIQVGYDASHLVSELIDFTGRRVIYDYYAPGEAGGSAGDLRSVTRPAVAGTPHGNDFPAGKTVTYTYTRGFVDDWLNHNLLTVTDAAGRTYLENAYGATDLPGDGRNDRVAYQILPGGILAFTYLALPPDPRLPQMASSTMVNDRAGNVSRYDYDGANRLLRERHFTGRAPDPTAPSDTFQNQPGTPLRQTDPAWFETTYEYNADALVVVSQPPNGGRLNMQYDSANPDPRLRGNLLQQATLPGPLGGDQASIVESWNYASAFGTLDLSPCPIVGDPPKRPPPSQAMITNLSQLPPHSGSSFPTTHTDGRGLVTTFTYDLRGNLLEAEAPLVVTGTPGGTPQQIRNEWTYNAFGQVATHTSPAGREDRFEYHAAGPQTGYPERAVADAPGASLTTTFEYDARGNVVRVTDPRGNRTDRIYNALDQTVRVIEPAPFLYEIDYWYDEEDRLFRVDRRNADEDGTPRANPYLSRSYAHDPLGRVVRDQVEVEGGSACVAQAYEYDANDNLSRIESGEATSGGQSGNTVTRLYDERDLPFVETRGEGTPEQSSARLDYDASGNLAAVRRGLEDQGGSHDTTYAYDGYDRLTLRTDAKGNTESYHYDPNGMLTGLRVDGELTQGAGQPAIRLWEAGYLRDEADRVVREEVALFDTATGTPLLDGQATTRWLFDRDGRLLRTEDDNLHGLDYGYDSMRRLSSVVDAAGNGAEYAYDANSNLEQLTLLDRSDAGRPDETFVSIHAYDALDRHVSTVDNLGQTWSAEYDSQGDRTRTTDARGNVTRHDFDGLHRRVRTLRELTDTGTGGGNPIGTIVTLHGWDDNGRPLSDTDDNGNTTAYEYDALDRRVATNHPDGTRDLYAYDVHDRRVGHTDANGTAVQYDYDDLDRHVGTAVIRAPGVGGTATESYAYDGLSRMRAAADDDSEVTFEYDSLSNVARETLRIAGGPLRQVLGSHDGVGNVVQRVYPSGRAVTYQYDALDRLQSLTDGQQPLATWFYVGPGRLQFVTRSNGATTSYEHDALGRVTRTLHEVSSVPRIDLVAEWDGADNLRRLRDNLVPGRTIDYAYDSIRRLTSTERREPGPTVEAVDYLYDGVGNRSLVVGGGEAGPYVLDATLPDPADFQCNQYTQTPRGARLYDDNGATLAADDRTGIVNDFRDQMVAVTTPGGALAFRYDALGRRIESSEGTAIRRFYSAGGAVVEEQDGADTPQITLIDGGAGLEEMREEADQNGDSLLDSYRYHVDANGSVRALTDGTGAVVESYDYDDFGLPRVFNGAGTPIGNASAVGNPYLFRGMRWDDATRLYHGARYYDPSAGRFTTRDAAAAWEHLGNAATFARSNPLYQPSPYGGGGGSRAEGIDYNSSRSNKSNAIVAPEGGGGSGGGSRAEGIDYNSSRSNKSNAIVAPEGGGGSGGGSRAEGIDYNSSRSNKSNAIVAPEGGGGSGGGSRAEGIDYNSSRSNKSNVIVAPGGGGGSGGGSRAEGIDYNSSRSNKSNAIVAPGGGGGSGGGSRAEGIDYNSSRSNKSNAIVAPGGGGGGGGGSRAEGIDYNSSRSNKSNAIVAPGGGCPVGHRFIWRP